MVTTDTNAIYDQPGTRADQLQAALNDLVDQIRTPTLIIGAENDAIAPVGSHSILFYNSIPASAEKAYLELNGAGHFVANSPDTTLAKYAISWLKRYIDNDTRYEQFLCPAPRATAISDYRDTCPGT